MAGPACFGLKSGYIIGCRLAFFPEWGAIFRSFCLVVSYPMLPLFVAQTDQERSDSGIYLIHGECTENGLVVFFGKNVVF